MNALLEHCSASFSAHEPIFLVFFLGGLTGGFTHCLSMCGPIVASETVACKSACGSCSKTKNLGRSTGLPYHLGRITTYGALGFFAALLSKQIQSSSIWPVASSVMLTIAGLMFLISSLPGCKHSFFKASGKLTYFRGALMGFMPCGLIYAALMMAATLADPISGMVAMWIFVLGTIPALLIASIGAEFLTQKWQGVMSNVGRAVMALNGIFLIMMAEGLMR